MKNYILGLFIGSLVVAGVGMNGGMAHAMTPTLSVYATGNGDSVQITVNGDSYGGVTLYYQKSGYGTQSSYLGSTNSNGYFSTTVSTASYGIVSGSSVYVIVNNQQSSSIAWPYNYNNNSSSIVISPSNITVMVGQSINVTISGGTTPYTMYPATYNLFQSAISGNTLTITGIAAGSSSMSICSSGGAYSGNGCSTLYITVTNQNYQNAGYAGSSQGWTFCANEDQWCSFSGTQTVRFGVNGNYYYKTATNGVSCSNSAFGDPAYGLFKQCWYGGTPANSYNYNPYNANIYQPTYPPNIYQSGRYTFTRTLSYGSYGNDVRELQRRLRSEDVYWSSTSGWYGPMTRAGVKRFQAARGLTQSGVVDYATLAELNR